MLPLQRMAPTNAFDITMTMYGANTYILCYPGNVWIPQESKLLHVFMNGSLIKDFPKYNPTFCAMYSLALETAMQRTIYNLPDVFMNDFRIK